MYELRPLSTTAIPAALAKAERYRLLNEPSRPRASASTSWPPIRTTRTP